MFWLSLQWQSQDISSNLFCFILVIPKYLGFLTHFYFQCGSYNANQENFKNHLKGVNTGNINPQETSIREMCVCSGNRHGKKSLHEVWIPRLDSRRNTFVFNKVLQKKKPWECSGVFEVGASKEGRYHMHAHMRIRKKKGIKKK